MKESVGLHNISFATLTGTQVEHRVRLLYCPKKRWFHRTKHATRLVSCDYVMDISGLNHTPSHAYIRLTISPCPSGAIT